MDEKRYDILLVTMKNKPRYPRILHNNFYVSINITLYAETPLV